jgi:microcystin-dependent protein
MPIDFPNSPTTGQIYTYLGNSWIWNGTGWDVPKAGSLNLENLVPPGTVTQFAGATAPTGYLLCQGQSLSTTTFGNLFNVIGYTYGGSGSSFLLPNLQNRVPVGKGPDTEFDVLGETGGAKTVTLTEAQMPSHTHTTPNHSHTFSATTNSTGSHSHGFVLQNPGWVGGGFNAVLMSALNNQYTNGGQTGGTQDAGAHTHTVSGTTSNSSPTTNSTGSGGAHNNLQPYIVLNYIIKT